MAAATDGGAADCHAPPSTAEEDALELVVCSLAGREWRVKAGTASTGRALKRHVAGLMQASPLEVALARGVHPIGDYEPLARGSPGELVRVQATIVRKLHVLSASWDRQVWLWDVETGASVCAFQASTGRLACVAVDRTLRRVLTGGHDRLIRLWDLHPHLEGSHCDAQPLLVLRGHSDTVNCVDVDWDTGDVASGSEDKTVRIWHMGSAGSVARVMTGHTGAVNCVAANWASGFVLSGSDDAVVKMWEVASGALLLDFEGHEDAINCLAADWGAGRALSGCDAGSLILWDIDRGLRLKDFVADPCEVTEAHHGQIATQVNCVVMDHPSGRALSGHRDGIVRLWHLEQGVVLLQLLGHSSQVQCVHADWGAARAVAGSRAGSLRVWDLETAETVQVLRGHRGAVRCLAAPVRQASSTAAC